MKRYQQRIVALLLTVALLLGMAPAAAAEGDTQTTPTKGIIYQGRETSAAGTWLGKWFYQNVKKDSGTTYTDTDLFANFKGVMPGDRLQQDFIVKNESGSSINLYMALVPHGEGNPLSGEVAAQTTTSSALAFLNQLEMKITAGEGAEAVTLFEASRGQLGALASEKQLGVLRAQEAVVLHVYLTVPVDMDNEFMYLQQDAAAGDAKGIGEVDMLFRIWENSGEIDPDPPTPVDPTKPVDPSKPSDPTKPVDPSKPGGEIDNPGQPPVSPENPTIIPGKPVGDVEDPQLPLKDAPKTGDNNNPILMLALMLAAAFGLIIMRKRVGKY